jgi:aromatic-amino-acid transaminase
MSSFFSEITTAAPDAILGITEAFRNDPSPTKVNLGVGVYQDADGRIPMLLSIQEAAKRWLTMEESKTYLPIDGVASFNSANQELIFGKDSPLIKEKKIVTVQTVGGSGALKLGIDFLRRFFPESSLVLSDPSWENHRSIFEATGIKVDSYPYYDPKTSGLRAADMLEALRALKPRTIVLLHACCHNPTGVDLDSKTWEEVVSICAERNLIPFIDCAYQGFAEGLEADASPIRLFAQKGLTFLVANSFAKSFSMYRERVGGLSIVTGSEKEAAAVLSQIKRVVRTIYSSPPSYGAQLVGIVLNDPELRSMWVKELDEMRTRIGEMRQLFSARLKEIVPGRDFSFITRQRGMFSYSGLTAQNMKALKEQHHVYALDSGRICVATLNRKNVDYVCESIAKVIS